MKPRILCVDDDQNLLASYRRQLRKDFDVETAPSAAQGLRAVRGQAPFAVVMADMRMPEMDGVQFLTAVREEAPQSVRIMMTGNADVQTAVDAVNRGAVFRFLCKPTPAEELLAALQAAVEQYELVRAEKRVLQETLASVATVLGDLLSLANPMAFDRALRLRELMSKLACKLSPDNRWEFEVSGLLSQIGTLTLPALIVSKVAQGKVLEPTEQQLFDAHPQIGHDLVAHIPRFENVALVIGLQEVRADESGAPTDSAPEGDMPLAARALHLAIDFDSLVHVGKTWHEALAEIERAGDWYDPKAVEALAGIVREELRYEVREYRIAELQAGMVLEEDVKSFSGEILKRSKGQELTLTLRAWLQNHRESLRIKEPVKVRVYAPETPEA